MSSAEVESVLAEMAGVAEVAVVAAPDARYGEHGAAIVRLLVRGLPASVSKSAQQHLVAGGLARQKWPEELHFVDDFPRTPSGKIQKNVLRAALRAGRHHASLRGPSDRGGSGRPCPGALGGTPGSPRPMDQKLGGC